MRKTSAANDMFSFECEGNARSVFIQDAFHLFAFFLRYMALATVEHTEKIETYPACCRCCCSLLRHLLDIDAYMRRLCRDDNFLQFIEFGHKIDGICLCFLRRKLQSVVIGVGDNEPFEYLENGKLALIIGLSVLIGVGIGEDIAQRTVRFQVYHHMLVLCKACIRQCRTDKYEDQAY